MSNKKIHDIYYREGSLEDWLTAATYLHIGELICYSEGHKQSSIRFFHDTGKELSESLKTTSAGVDSVFIIGRDASQHACDGVFRSSWSCAITNVRHWCVNIVEAPESPDKLNNIRSLDRNDTIMSLPYAVYMTHEYDSDIDNISGIPAILRAFEAYTEFNFNITDTLNHTYAEIVNLLPNFYSHLLPNDVFVQLLFDNYDAKQLKKWMQSAIKLLEDDRIDTLNNQMKEFVSGKKSNTPKQEFMYDNTIVTGQPPKRYDELIPLTEGKIIAEKIARDVLDNARSVNNGVRDMIARAGDMLHEFHQECYMPSSAELELAGQDSDSGDHVGSEDTCRASEETEKPDNDSIAELKIEDLATSAILEKLTAWAKGICPFNEDNSSGYFILDDDNLDDYDKLHQICNVAFFKINLPGLHVSMGRLGYYAYSFEDVAVIYRGKDELSSPLNQPLDYARFVTGSNINAAIDICKNVDGKYIVTFDINAHAFNFDVAVKFCEGLKGHCGSELDHRAREFINLFYLRYPYRVILDQTPIVVSDGPSDLVIVPSTKKSIPLPGVPNTVLDIYQSGATITIYISAIEEGTTTLELTDMRKMPLKPISWTDDINAIPNTIPTDQRIRKFTLIFPQFAIVDGDDELITFRIPDIYVVDLSDMDVKIPTQTVYDYVSDRLPKNTDLGGIVRITKSSGTECYRHSSLFSENNDDWGIQCQSSDLSKDKEALAAINKYFNASETARRSGFLLTKKIFDAFSPARNYVAKTVYLSTGLSLKISVDVTGDIAFVRFASGTFIRD